MLSPDVDATHTTLASENPVEQSELPSENNLLLRSRRDPRSGALTMSGVVKIEINESAETPQKTS